MTNIITNNIKTLGEAIELRKEGENMGAMIYKISLISELVTIAEDVMEYNDEETNAVDAIVENLKIEVYEYEQMENLQYTTHPTHTIQEAIAEGAISLIDISHEAKTTNAKDIIKQATQNKESPTIEDISKGLKKLFKKIHEINGLKY